MLKYAKGATFATKFDEYIKAGTTRAVPSLFTNVKQLYAEKDKVDIIEGIIVKHLATLRANNCFSDQPEIEQDPTVLLWLLLFAAHHFDTKKDFTQAMVLIEETIEHTPTLVEAYTVKAKIFKHMCDFVKAMETYDRARTMDQADRYLNARCSKYMIRAGKLEEAEGRGRCAYENAEGAPPERTAFPA